MTLPQVVGLVGIIVFTLVFVAGLLIVAEQTPDPSEAPARAPTQAAP